MLRYVRAVCHHLASKNTGQATAFEIGYFEAVSCPCPVSGAFIVGAFNRLRRPPLARTVCDGVSRHPLIAYFVIAFAGTWLTILPLLLGQDGGGLFAYRFGEAGILFAVAGAFTGPLLASLLVTFVTSGTHGMRTLLRRYAQWRVGILWYVVALFGYFFVWLAGYCVWLSGAPLFALIAKPWLIFGSYLAPLAILLVLAFGEETGWRGFALPRLQEQYGPLRGTLILGTLHGLWHLPALGVPGFVSNSALSLPFVTGWIATVIAATVLYTWIFNNTNGSLLIATLVHAGSNASSSLLGALVPEHPILQSWQAAIYKSRWNLANLIPFAVTAVLLIIFTRGRLCYSRNRMSPSPGTYSGTHPTTHTT
jgi:membrane protease YdiL (CAAX protease family)